MDEIVTIIARNLCKLKSLQIVQRQLLDKQKELLDKQEELIKKQEELIKRDIIIKPNIWSEPFALCKPFLKWVGGKTQIIHQILEYTPEHVSDYHEIFVGGGSVLLAHLSLLKHKNINITDGIYAYDINEKLINVYKQIQNNKNELFNQIQVYITAYDTCPHDKEKKYLNRKPKNLQEASLSKENYYYWMRAKFNSIELKAEPTVNAALFMVINKTAFRGMYREGPNGFNVPYGNYKTTPTVITKQRLDEISELIKDVKFICCDFEIILNKLQTAKSNTYVYLDPPYAPETSTSFVGYNKSGFGVDKHKKLFELVKSLNSNNKKISFCMSNADVKLVTDSFNGYDIKRITCKRSINSKKPQSKTTEVIISNN